VARGIPLVPAWMNSSRAPASKVAEFGREIGTLKRSWARPAGLCTHRRKPTDIDNNRRGARDVVLDVEVQPGAAQAVERVPLHRDGVSGTPERSNCTRPVTGSWPV